MPEAMGVVQQRATKAVEVLADILRRKRVEVERRKRHPLRARTATLEVISRRARAEAALRRTAGEDLRVIAEIKRKSPSAGVIRARALHDVQQIARMYQGSGAAAVSVLCDRVGFGGSVLDLRRAAQCIDIPILFKEFVLDSIQVELAREVGASMVLLMVNSLDDPQLSSLVDTCHEFDLAPVVEAANAAELARALATNAVIIGINARDLHTFSVNSSSAHQLVADIPRDRIAVHMSGVTSKEAFASVAKGRADAVLIGEALMRAKDPGAKLLELLGS